MASRDRTPRVDTEDTPIVDSEPEDACAPRPPKHRFAVFFGYVGARFQGLQKNPGALTVETELEAALHKAGLITDRCLNDFAAIGWNRAARTDKGVHAALNVISLRMRIADGGEADAVARVNSHLKSDLRVFAMIITTFLFNSKNFCSGRLYGYLLPTFALATRAVRAPVARYVRADDFSSPDAAAAYRAVRGVHLTVDSAALALDAYCNGSAAAVAAREIWQARVRAWEQGAAGLCVGAGAGRGVYADAGIHASAGRAVSSPSFAVPRTANPDPFETGAAFVFASIEMRERASAAAARARGPYRLPPERHALLSRVLSSFVGTRAYHNFTPRLVVGDASTMRYVTSVEASEPFLIGDIEFVRLAVAGQSFLLNQIRHMVGLAVDVVAGAAPEQMMSWAFTAAELKLPLAPAEGLYLERCFFEAYDAKYARGSSSTVGAHTPLTVLPRAASVAADAFLKETIWGHMAAATVTRSESGAMGGPFVDFVRELTQTPLSYRMRFRESTLTAIRASAPKRGRDGTSALLEAPLTSIFGTGAVSKEAKEKREWRDKIREEKERIRAHGFAKRQAKADAAGNEEVGEGEDTVPGPRAEGDVNDDDEGGVAGVGAGAGAGAGTMADADALAGAAPKRGYWAGGRGHLKHRGPPNAGASGGGQFPAKTQTWRPPKRARE